MNFSIAQDKVDSKKQQEMMATYMELAKPGKEHKMLKSLVRFWE